MKRADQRIPSEAKFRRKILVDPSGCWLWTGKKTDRGYGSIYHQGKNLSAHRVSYQLFKGPIPKGKEIDHLCRIHGCVNPDHLEAVTHQVNVLRGDAGKRCRSRTHCNHGHPFDEVNTYVRPDGSRGCRKCRSKARRRHYYRNVESERARMRTAYHAKKQPNGTASPSLS